MRGRTLIVGLGNPGQQYAATRHNVGFRVVDRIARRLGTEFGAPGSGYRLATASDSGSPLVLMKPLTYMNRSGEAVAAWLEQQGVRAGDADPEAGGQPAPELLVVCDDLNLPLGALRLRPGGGGGGQNGLADIIAALGTEEFPRLRLGIAPVKGPLDPALWADFVLSPFTSEESPAVDDMVERAATAALAWFEHGCEYAASRFNRRGGVPPEE